MLYTCMWTLEFISIIHVLLLLIHGRAPSTSLHYHGSIGDTLRTLTGRDVSDPRPTWTTEMLRVYHAC